MKQHVAVLHGGIRRLSKAMLGGGERRDPGPRGSLPVSVLLHAAVLVGVGLLVWPTLPVEPLRSVPVVILGTGTPGSAGSPASVEAPAQEKGGGAPAGELGSISAAAAAETSPAAQPASEPAPSPQPESQEVPTATPVRPRPELSRMAAKPKPVPAPRSRSLVNESEPPIAIRPVIQGSWLPVARQAPPVPQAPPPLVAPPPAVAPPAAWQTPRPIVPEPGTVIAALPDPAGHPGMRSGTGAAPGVPGGSGSPAGGAGGPGRGEAGRGRGAVGAGPAPSDGDFLQRLQRHTQPFVQRSYPVDAIGRKEEGMVEVAVRLDASGAVLEAVIERSSGSRSLDQAALAAVRAASPLPRPPEHRLGATITLPIRYSLSLASKFF